MFHLLDSHRFQCDNPKVRKRYYKKWNEEIPDKCEIQGNKTETTYAVARYEVFTLLLFKIRLMGITPGWLTISYWYFGETCYFKVQGIANK